MGCYIAFLNQGIRVQEFLGEAAMVECRGVESCDAVFPKNFVVEIIMPSALCYLCDSWCDAGDLPKFGRVTS